jgi:hypothetical protein
MKKVYKTKFEIERIVSDFEACRTGKDDFHHAHHLVVAIVYLESLSLDAAVKKLREALLRFLDLHSIDTQKYNETLTVFWLEMVALELRRLPEDSAIVDKCNSVIEVLDNPKLVSEYYSDEVLWSDEARNAFVDPDLKHWGTIQGKQDGSR